MKKALISIAVIIAAAALLAGGYAIRYYTEPCEPGIIEAGDPGPLSPTSWTDTSPAAQYAGDHIDIAGAMRGQVFRVTAWDRVKSNSREFPLTAICKPRVRPYSIWLHGFMLAGYDRDLKRFDAIAGGTAGVLWNFSRGSVGVGITYAQSVIYPAYYAGASVMALIDIGKPK